MDTSLILQNLLSPPILFFFLGMIAVFVRSDLEIPQPLPKLLSLYLLLSIGFEGGVNLSASGLTSEALLTLLAALVMASFVPLYSYVILRTKLDIQNSAAIAATYGSISAVTFITAGAFLGRLGEEYGGHLVAAMALMESPAIVIGVLLVRVSLRKQGVLGMRWSAILRDAFLNGSVFLLIGSLLIGASTGEQGWESIKPFSKEIFKGILMFFLLDMGLVAAKRIRDIGRTGVFLILFAITIPVINAFLGIAVSSLIGINTGDALMFSILCGSASYIAVPAAMRVAVPEANPSLYVPMSLAITFPFNIIIGIPMYSYIIHLLWN